MLSHYAALVVGQSPLQQPNAAPSGVFTLLVENHNEQWVIVYDHTSLLLNINAKLQSGNSPAPALCHHCYTAPHGNGSPPHDSVIVSWCCESHIAGAE